MVKWTYKDTVECYKQGWAPFNTDDGTTEIFALDDPFGVAQDHNFEFKGTYFKGRNRDRNAVRSVQRKAARGNDLCKRALQLCKKNQFVGDKLPFMD
jgi:hypothetical protein